ncbi:MAG: YeeE/YedE family protein [Ahrensia sp.]|nr:YeeE/YedE family protein [Ahrensia sp.]
MRIAMGFLCGLIFGVGLVISGMANPAKVLNFLDVFGNWDPSLAFVMGSAVLVTFVGYRWVLGRAAPLFDARFHLPTRSDIDGQLLTGAGLFGIGWGLGGFCPGPAYVALPLASFGIAAFFPAMLIGMWAGRASSARLSTTAVGG